MRVKIFSVLVAFALFSSMLVFADKVASPVDMLRGMSNVLIHDFRNAGVEGKTTSRDFDGIIEKQVLPHIDQNTMAQSVIGRHYWQLASVDQRSRFQVLFRQLLVRFYARSLRAYKDQEVKFMPLRSGALGRQIVSVYSMIISPSQRPVPLVYRVRKYGNKWKIIDFLIDGVSIVASYRAQFSGILERSGMQSLLDEIQNKLKRSSR